ncbi:hypothetical protein NOMA109596_12735 [Nocardioides marinus]
MSGHPTCVNVLDHDSRLVLAHRAATRPDFWGPTEDASGADASGAVEVVVDPAALVRAVRVCDPGLLRTPEALQARVLEAHRAADTARAVAVQLAHSVEEPPATPEALVASLQPRVRRPSDAVRHARMVADSGGTPPTHAPPPRGVQGLSQNGMVTVGTDADGRPATVLADPAWLSAATAGGLQQALLQAFQRAFTHYADTLTTATGGTS